MSIELVTQDEALVARADEVRRQLGTIKADLVGRSLELGRLLKEVRDNGYHRLYGHARFGEWIQQEESLDISERSAFSFIKIVELQERLQLSDGEMSKNKLSHLIEIASMPEDTPDERIKGLLKDAESAKLGAVKAAVSAAKGQTSTFHTLKFVDADSEAIWLQAIERVRADHGGYNGDNGPRDVSESMAAIYLAGNYLAQPSQFGAPDVELSFEDVVEAG